MRAFALAGYDIKRLVRHRALLVVMLAVPLVVALVRAVFPDWYFGLACAWSCPLVCAVLTFVVLFVQRSVDSISGLTAAIRSAPLSEGALAASRVIAGVLIFAVQMAILGSILLLRF